MTTNRQIVLASRPEGPPGEGNFRLVESDIPKPGQGQVLGRTIYLSLDPYMRSQMRAGPSYASPVEIGQVMVGHTVGQVVESSVPEFQPGDTVLSYGGWQEYWVAEAGASGPAALRRLDPAAAPISTALGVLGMPGMTAYTGLLEIGRPKPSETLVVAAASGAVGSVVGQIARIHGCRAVGVAGSREKCDFVTHELGFDACVDHRAADFLEALKRACPDGIDIYFENVGGAVFEAVLGLVNDFARIPVCGLIAHYNATKLLPGPLPKLMLTVITKRLTLRGFIVSDFHERQTDFLRDVAAWIRDGRVKYREDIVEGLESAPAAFIGLLEGRNFGKLLVRVAPDPTR